MFYGVLNIKRENPPYQNRKTTLNSVKYLFYLCLEQFNNTFQHEKTTIKSFFASDY